MARDYKYRAQGRNKAPRRQSINQQQSVGLWKWMLITALIILFVVFLVYLRSTGSNQIKPEQITQVIPIKPDVVKKEAPKHEKKPDPELTKPITTAKPGPASVPEPVLPQFDFYTILPEKEVVVPDYEINTRAREERVGQAKKSSYIMQAGSFREFKDADSLRAKLALMGIESRVEKAKVGNVIWNRVKMGPYDRMASVSSIRARLRQNGIDVIVTETGR